MQTSRIGPSTNCFMTIPGDEFESWCPHAVIRPLEYHTCLFQKPKPKQAFYGQKETDRYARRSIRRASDSPRRCSS